MKLLERLPAIAVGAVVLAGVAIVFWRIFPGSEGPSAAPIRVPELSQLALKGEKAFNANCAACHGTNGAGTNQGPPLVHDIYNPGHHADAAFVAAVRRGVRRHHWSFGDMPPRPGVTDPELAAIIRYVRELQVANGIRYRKHTM